MQHPFSVLKAEYAALFSHVVITRNAEAETIARRLLNFLYRYSPVSVKTGIPIAWIAASFEREASSNFRLSPAQGDRWDRVSTHVPKGRGPFRNWEEAALDAYALDDTDDVGAANWTWERVCYEGEIFNGMGYRAHGIHSPYLWSGTNAYTKGKYTADGHWEPNVRDQQLGIIPIMLKMIELDATLELPGAAIGKPGTTLPPGPTEPPIGLGGELDTAWLQRALNDLQDAGLVVDGSYGRRTKAAVKAFQHTQNLEEDGLAGPLTKAALQTAVALHEGGMP